MLSITLCFYKSIPLIRKQNIKANLTDEKTVEPAESKLKKFKSLILQVPRNRLWCSSKVSLRHIRLHLNTYN